MSLARQGNFTDQTRQGSMYFGFDALAGNVFVRALKDCNSHEISKRNIACQMGYIGDVTDGKIEHGLYAPGIMISSENVEGLNDKLAENMGYISAEEMELAIKHGTTIIKGGYINTDLLEVGAIKAKHIEAGSITAEKMAVGALKINELYNFDGTRKYIDENGASFANTEINNKGLTVGNSIQLTEEGLPELSKLLGGANSGSVASTSAHWSGKPGERYSQPLGSALVNVNIGSTLTIKGSVSAYVRAFSGNEFASCSVNIILYRNGVPLRAIGYASVYNGGLQDSVVDNFDYTFPNVLGGTYQLYFECYLNSDIPLLDNGCSATLTSMSFNYAPNIMRSIIAYGGMGVYMNTDNYFELRQSQKSDGSKYLKMAFKGEMDSSGILCSYSVYNTGSIIKRFGARAKTGVNASKLANGKYRVPHSIGHSDYIVQVNASSDGHTVCAAVVLGKTNSYTDIGIADINGGFRDNGFEITIIGKN